MHMHSFSANENMQESLLSTSNESKTQETANVGDNESLNIGDDTGLHKRFGNKLSSTQTHTNNLN